MTAPKASGPVSTGRNCDYLAIRISGTARYWSTPLTKPAAEFDCLDGLQKTVLVVHDSKSDLAPGFERCHHFQRDKKVQTAIFKN